MDIQSLIKLAHQADLEGNYRVADKLTERAMRIAGPKWWQTWRGPFGRQNNVDFSNDASGANLSGGSSTSRGGNTGPASSGRANSGGGGGGGAGGRGTNIDLGGGGGGESSTVRNIRDKQRRGETLNSVEEEILRKANERNRRDRENRTRQRAEGGDGGRGARGGDNDTSITQDSSSTSGGAGGGSLTQIQRGRYQTRDNYGNITGIGAGGAIGLAAIPALLGAYGFYVMNGKVVDRGGKEVSPDRLPPAVKNLISGDFKANQLALRAQAGQMKDADDAQRFVEDRKGDPRFRSAQDFYNDAKNKNYDQSMINQITALAKAEGYPDLTPYTN